MTFGTYANAPLLAWSGWRLRVPGGPEGGQYHGFIAPDSSQGGWPTGRSELGGLGAVPQLEQDPGSTGPWEQEWGGTILDESEGHSDHVYRGPGEVRPRPNASGGAHVFREFQTKRTPGYAEAPGNYKDLGAMMRNGGGGGGGIQYNVPPFFFKPPAPTPVPVAVEPVAIRPAYDPRILPPSALPPVPIRFLGPPTPLPGPTATVAQPPPPTTPAPAPWVSDPTQCPTGMYRDAAGNCTSDWSHPSSLYLPVTPSPRPAPTVAASPADFLPSQGQPLTQSGFSIQVGSDGTYQVVATNQPTTITQWMEASTIWPGVKNKWIAGGVIAAFVLMNRGKR